MRFLIFFTFVTFLSSHNTIAQQESEAVPGVTVIIPNKEKNKTSYFSFGGGYQIPTLVNVPMLPENAPNITKESDMEVIIPGWFAQFGINKKTRSNFDIGLLSGYYKNSVPVALEGEISTSDWVLEQSGSLSTDIYDEDIIRTSTVLSIRALVKYKFDIKNTNLWLGIAGGTYSTTIDYSYSNDSSPNETYRQTSLGASYLAGFDILKRNTEGEDIFAVTLFGDFSGPSINEFFINLFELGKYENTPGNHSINPFRIGLSLSIY